MKTSRTQNSALNATASIAAHFISLLMSFIGRSVFIANMNAEYLGISGLFTNILTVLSLVELGIGDALAYAFYKPMQEQNWEELNQLAAFAKWAYRVLACIVAAIGIGTSFFLEYLIADPPVIRESLRCIFFFYLANSVCSYLLVYKSIILIADQRQYISSLVLQGVKVLQQILQVIVLVVFRSFYLYLLCQIICTIVNNVVIWRIIGKQYPQLKGQCSGRLPREKLDRIRKDMASLSVSKIAGVVANGTDNIIISKMIGLTEVGLVSNYTLINNAVNGVLWQGIRALMGSIGNFNACSTQTQRRRVFDELMLLCYGIYSVACVCIMVLSASFVELCWGAEYILPNRVVFAMVLTLYVTGVNFAAYSFRVTMGEFGIIKYFHLAAGILNLIVSVLVAPAWGLFGVFLATSVTRVFTSEIVDGYLVAVRILGRRFWWYVKQYLYMFVVFLFNCWITGLLVAKIQLSGVGGFLAESFLSAVCSCGIVLLFFGWTAQFHNLLKRAKTLLKHT